LAPNQASASTRMPSSLPLTSRISRKHSKNALRSKLNSTQHQGLLAQSRARKSSRWSPRRTFLSMDFLCMIVIHRRWLLNEEKQEK
jgi:hypothetical protein